MESSSKQTQMNFNRRPDRSKNLQNEDLGNRGKEASSKQKLMKTLLKFKKNKKPTAGKGGMNTVKIDFWFEMKYKTNK